MKFLFLTLFFFSTASFAQKSIKCYNQDRSENFSINTKTGKILLNNKIEVTGAVYSGINENTNYNGEILGEITTDEMSFYISMIVRNVQDKLTLETIWYPKAEDRKVIKANYDNCRLK